MSANKKKNPLQKYLTSNETYPFLAGLATGLYPILFYCSNNYSLVNSWGHLLYFIFYFLCCPVFIFFFLNFIIKKNILGKWGKYVLPFFSVFIFLFLMAISYYAGFDKKMSMLVFIASLGFSFFFYKQVKKVIVIQLIFACIGIYTLTPSILKEINYSNDWMNQPDDIENVKFTKKPNVYFIQPDGYANISELKKENYNVDHSEFENFLIKENFKYYEDFRSNYASTLSSNSSIFMMKHHYYFNEKNFSEAIKTRDIIITKNPVLDIFKNNNYKTHFIAEMPYLLLNRPDFGYDVCNFNYKDISYIGTGLGERQDILTPLIDNINTAPNTPKFFFIEIFNPGHVHGNERDSLGEEGERQLWKNCKENADIKLIEIISAIKERDPNSLIVIMADHGGFVGMEYTGQTYFKTQDRDIVYSIFTSILAIHWPNGIAPDFDTSFSSSVNVFRILFSYLSDNETYLQNLQPNESYVILKDKEFSGVYQYIDENGNITLEKK